MLDELVRRVIRIVFHLRCPVIQAVARASPSPRPMPTWPIRSTLVIRRAERMRS